jgi:hypothetical protein
LPPFKPCAKWYRRRTVLLALAASAALGAGSGRARAQSPERPAVTREAAAQALFEEGRRLLAAGNVAEACQRFETSQHLDPGAGTELNLADCYERKGMLASAWVTFRGAGADARRSARAEWATLADARAEALEARVPKVVLHVAAAAGGAIEVRIDGQPIGQESRGLKIPLDPGGHRLVASAPGFTPFEKAFTLEVGDQKTIDLPPLLATPAAPAAPVATRPDSPVAAPVAVPLAKSGEGRSLLPLGLGMAGLGLVGIGVGVGFAVLANSKNSEAAMSCPDPSQCPASSDAPELTADAKTARTESIVSFSVGGALAVASGILIGVAVAEKARPLPTPTVTPTAAITPEGWRVGIVGAF